MLYIFYLPFSVELDGIMHVFIDDTVSLGMNNLIPNTCERTDSIAWKLEQLRKIEVNILVSRKKNTIICWRKPAQIRENEINH